MNEANFKKGDKAITANLGSITVMSGPLYIVQCGDKIYHAWEENMTLDEPSEQWEKCEGEHRYIGFPGSPLVGLLEHKVKS